mmetsp:Transcript_31057/g.48619  ORF Transcript_31057/g.48619 Transcript_31057/m.48619 type:complete len:119 (-) Transcript_31057:97-453(-)|eukprot:CAMPEP_0201731660 /NCGR_PEP_ID=MMETSP0593-20130828/26471_1 /ASSEMBLY_ACC=CAM_ASM_000672 /TAXON_ID=267983 /ORGANISM="Skeletonema japonicum, Strain CCMP2506" /LENGTH=118 /DNA_ID=CAMNT_0048224477 /DNA_START=62 /DNA_END=418 /DNA_ORIENTATION=+
MCEKKSNNNKSASSAATPISCWASSVEHVIKAALYTYICHRSVTRAIDSVSPYSTATYALAGLYALWMVKNELNMIIKRLQRKLPPGYLGFPFLREIQFIQILSSGGIMKSLHEKRNK